MPTTTQHILVVSNETAASEELLHTVHSLAADPAARVLVVTPALHSRSRHRVSDSDPALAAAETRLDECIDQFAGLGLHVGGRVGDEDPLRAMADALAGFPATEVVIATHPEGRSSWLAQDLVHRALAQFGLPTVHVVVDPVAPWLHREAVAA